MSLKGSKILISGGAGFVGTNLCQSLLSQTPAEIIIVDNLLSSEQAQIPQTPSVKFIHGSITDDNILSSIPSDLNYVFHLATYHGNQSSIHDPLLDHENNTLPSLKLFNVIKDFPTIKKVVYASAGCTVAQKTFDEAKATTENDQVSLYLDSPYQISKIIGEFYGNYYWHRYDLPFVKARFQNVYGPKEVLGAGHWRGTIHTIWRNVIPTFIFRALHQEPLPVDNNGIATRDFIFVDDIVNGLIACAIEGTPGEVYNLASGEETDILTLAQSINELAQNPSGIDFKEARDWDRSGKRYADTTKARSTLNFAANTSIYQGLDETIKWTKQNLDFIKQCMMRHIDHVPQIKKYFD